MECQAEIITRLAEVIKGIAIVPRMTECLVCLMKAVVGRHKVVYVHQKLRPIEI